MPRNGARMYRHLVHCVGQTCPQVSSSHLDWSDVVLLSPSMRHPVQIPSLQLRLEGADVVRVDKRGSLVADTSAGSVLLPPLLSADGSSLVPTVDRSMVSFSKVP